MTCKTGVSYTLGMPTPMFAFRLSAKTQEDLGKMAKVYGAPTASAFAREILETIISGDLEKVKAFNVRLMTKLGEQLQLQFNQAVDQAAAPKKPAKKATKRPARAKTRGRR